MDVVTFCSTWSERFRRHLIREARYPQENYEESLFAAVPRGARWLDVGCGHHLLPEWRGDQERELISRCQQIIGIDYDLPSLRRHRSITTLLRGDAVGLPFPDECFDIVTANMVVEHLDHPMLQFREIARVLKPEGQFIFHTPNVWGYQTAIARLIPETLKKPMAFWLTRRHEQDIFPTFYRANSRRAIESVARSAGFISVRLKMVQGPPLAMLLVLPPIYFIILLWVKLVLTDPLRNFRGNIVATLRKPGSQAPRPAR